MKITKLVAVVGALVSVVPVGVPAQNAGAKSPARTVARSDVRELPADQQIIQALSRLTFGPRPGDVQKVRAIGLDNWIDQQLRPNKINDVALEQFVARYLAINQDQNDLLRQYSEQQRARRQVRQERADTTRDECADSIAMRHSCSSSSILRDRSSLSSIVPRARAVASERQLQEVMTDSGKSLQHYAQKGGPERTI